MTVPGCSAIDKESVLIAERSAGNSRKQFARSLAIRSSSTSALNRASPRHASSRKTTRSASLFSRAAAKIDSSSIERQVLNAHFERSDLALNHPCDDNP